MCFESFLHTTHFTIGFRLLSGISRGLTVFRLIVTNATQSLRGGEARIHFSATARLQMHTVGVKGFQGGRTKEKDIQVTYDGLSTVSLILRFSL